jgi:hypothetical protein
LVCCAEAGATIVANIAVANMLDKYFKAVSFGVDEVS